MTNQLRFAHVVARFVDVPLLLLPRHAVAMWNILCGRFGTAPGELPDEEHWQEIDARFAALAAAPSASRFAGEQAMSQDGRKAEPYRRVGDTAILPVVGELVNRGAWLGSNSGMVSYEGLKHQLGRIRADQRVSRVLLDMDSPGGEAVGFDVAAKAVRDLSAEKPVTAVVNGMAASAAYALASGAKHIVTTPTGISGSIGVVMLHLDHSRQIEKAGVTPTLIYAGRHKVDANPFEPLSGDVHEALQKEVEGFYSAFIGTVVAGRAGRTSARTARDTEARTYIGQDAVDARLADSVGSFEEVLEDMASRKPRTSRSKAMTRTVTIAEVDDAQAPGDELLIAQETEESSDADTEAVATLVEMAHRDGMAAMAKRIEAVLADERSKGRERFAVRLACTSLDIPVASILDLAVEGTAAPAVRPIAERIAATNAAQVPSSAENPATPRSAWAKVTAPINRRVANSKGA